MVLNAEQVESILFGADEAAQRLPSGALVMLSSTVQPGYVESLDERLAQQQIELLDAPVSGGTARAAEGNLSIMASGSPAAFERAAPLLDAMAERVYTMGDKPGQGSTMKMVNQVLAGIHLAAAAEALALGARAGLDAQRMFEVICNSAGGSWMFENRVPHILADDYTPHSAVEIWLKDLGLVVDTGKELKVPTPLAAVAQQLFIMAAAAGHARLDDAAVIKVYEQLANFRVVDKHLDSDKQG
jgi:L-threonate 2-dehydrogenase